LSERLQCLGNPHSYNTEYTYKCISAWAEAIKLVTLKELYFLSCMHLQHQCSQTSTHLSFLYRWWRETGQLFSWVFGPKQHHLRHINLVCPQEEPAMELPQPPQLMSASPVLALNTLITPSLTTRTSV